MSPAPPPQDATVLVGAGADRSAWQMMDGGAPVTWAMNDGVLETGKGLIRTKAEFTDYQLHVEFATPKDVKGDSQGRGNSGVFLNGKFEIQVLDSYQNRTYADGSASAMYGQYPPLVNASRPPGEWQAYDIVFRRRDSARAASSTRRRSSPSCTTASSCTTRRRSGDRRRTRRSTRTRRTTPRADRAAGSRQPGALPQHLDPADQERRLTASR